MKKKILPSVLITIFSFAAFARIQEIDQIKPILYIAILVMGIGFY